MLNCHFSNSDLSSDHTKTCFSFGSYSNQFGFTHFDFELSNSSFGPRLIFIVNDTLFSSSFRFFVLFACFVLLLLLREQWLLNSTHITNSHNFYSLFGAREKKSNNNKTKTKQNKNKEKASSLISPSKVLSAFSLILRKIS